MKYYLLNRDVIKEDIWINPILIKTKSISKINKIRALQKKLDSLLKTVKKDLYDSNAGLTEEKINLFLQGETNTEITKKEYNTLLVMSLYDTQEQRIRCCNKTEILRGKLFGSCIK